MGTHPMTAFNRLGGTYGMAPDLPRARPRPKGAPPNLTKQAAVSALAAKRMDRHAIAAELGITLHSVDHYLTQHRLQHGSPFAPDSSVPKFAHDDRCIAAVMKTGGFPRLSERDLGGGKYAVCLPLIMPEQR